MTSTVLANGLAPTLLNALSSWVEGRNLEIARQLDSASSAELGLSVIGLQGGDLESLNLIRELRRKHPACPVLVVARDLTARLAFELGQLGVSGLLESPLSPTEVTAAAASCLNAGEPGEPVSEEMVGGSARMMELRRDMRAAARADATVLLQGETGSGKGLVARLIHQSSARCNKSFVHVDCASLSPTIIESELFGHERGAYTGAHARRIGRFEAAERGTLFLDEIGDLDPALQPKLLRVLQDRLFERVGGSTSIPMRARVIAATSHDLRRRISEGSFRRDLYYRLNVFRIDVPALRERREDIQPLAWSAVQTISERLGITTPRISDSVYEWLSRQSWPGNVRELFHALEAVLVRSEVTVIELEDLKPIEFLGEEPNHGALLPDFEELTDALSACGGNVRRVAESLGVPRTTLRRRIAELGLQHLTRNKVGRPERRDVD